MNANAMQKRWLCKYGEMEMEIYAKDKNEIMVTLQYYGFTDLTGVTISEIPKSKNDVDPIE